MDSEYLKEHVGVALSLGLSEICQKKPVDPIDYLSLWLRKYVENEKEKLQEIQDSEQLEKERQIFANEIRKKQALVEEQLQIEQQAQHKNI